MFWLLGDQKPKEILLTSFLLVYVYLLTHIVRHNCEKIRDNRLYIKERKDTAELIEAEMRCVLNHYTKNGIKLQSLLDQGETGKTLDYEKLKYHSGGLYSVKNEGLHRIEKQLVQDILVMNLFVRNNELEIQEAIAAIFVSHPKAKNHKEYQEKLKTRMEIAIIQSQELAKNLCNYADSPSKYIPTPLEWDDSWFKHAKDN